MLVPRPCEKNSQEGVEGWKKGRKSKSQSRERKGTVVADFSKSNVSTNRGKKPEEKKVPMRRRNRISTNQRPQYPPGHRVDNESIEDRRSREDDSGNG